MVTIIIIITLTLAMMMMVIIFIIMKIVRVRWLMITMERWMGRLMINLCFAHSEVRGPANKLEACRSVMIVGGCRSVDQEERHQVLVEHHDD